MSKFIIRFDDFTPNMAWSKFEQFECVLNKLNIRAIIGVVPNCLDINLKVESKKEDFWEIVRNLSSKGWTIAQHGYTHQYVTSGSGILGINYFSEFTGLPYHEQLEKIRLGKEILIKERVWQPVFMAPAHSFDKITLSALKVLGFKCLSDGYGIYPYEIEKIMAVPNLFSSPLNIGFGVYTMSLHINHLNQNQIDKTLIFIKNNRSKFISFNEALSIISIPFIAWIIRYLTKVLLQMYRH